MYMVLCMVLAPFLVPELPVPSTSEVFNRPSGYVRSGNFTSSPFQQLLRLLGFYVDTDDLSFSTPS